MLLPPFSLTGSLRRNLPGHDALTIKSTSGVTPDKSASPSLSAIFALIRAAADRHGVSAEFVQSIVAAESNFNAAALSPKGAIGLMQLMPATARQYGADPNVPEQNIDAGTRYLGFLMKRYRKSRSPLKNTIAAYNAGPAAVDRHRGVPPFQETRGYVVRVMGFLRHFLSQSGHAREPRP